MVELIGRMRETTAQSQVGLQSGVCLIIHVDVAVITARSGQHGKTLATLTLTPIKTFRKLSYAFSSLRQHFTKFLDVFAEILFYVI